FDRGERLGDVRLAQEVGLAVETQVDVTVDEAGRERPASAGDLASRPRLAWGARVRADPPDDALLEQDTDVLARPPSVEYRDVANVGGRHSGPSPAEPFPPSPASWRSAERSGEETRGPSTN